jgi:hypothetical protein
MLKLLQPPKKPAPKQNQTPGYYWVELHPGQREIALYDNVLDIYWLTGSVARRHYTDFYRVGSHPMRAGQILGLWSAIYDVCAVTLALYLLIMITIDHLPKHK